MVLTVSQYVGVWNYWFVDQVRWEHTLVGHRSGLHCGKQQHVVGQRIFIRFTRLALSYHGPRQE